MYPPSSERMGILSEKPSPNFTRGLQVKLSHTETGRATPDLWVGVLSDPLAT